MFKAIKRWWGYLTAKVNSDFNERADPKVQLEQAIMEAQEQHRRLRDQAANIIANQKQTEMRLNRSMGELEKVTGNAHQALTMADQAAQAGDAKKTDEYNRAAEAFADRMIHLESEVEDLKQLSLQAAQAADSAKAAVAQNSSALQQKLAERQKLLGQLDQAKMQEQVNKAMSSLSETVGEDVPTFDEVREKIEARYAKAKGVQELTGTSVDSRMYEIEQASANAQAQSRLAEMRSQMGLAPAGGTGTSSPTSLASGPEAAGELPQASVPAAPTTATPAQPVAEPHDNGTT